MISIIIPVFNQANKIGKCFESILSQSLHDYEVIVVSDGSTDSIKNVIEKYEPLFQGADINFQFFTQENKGAPSARNNGFSHSKGDYLLFCDADVELTPEALGIMLEKLKNSPKASYAYSSFMWGRKIFKLWEFDAEKLKQMPYIHTMALIRREHFPGFDETMKKFQDWDLWLTMLEQRHEGVWINKALFKVDTGGVMSSWIPKAAYKLMPFLPAVKKYNAGLKIIKSKHNL